MSLYEKIPQPMLSESTRIDLRARESYHVLKIISEFVESGEELQAIQPAVSIFGSARTQPDDPMYQKCEHIARLLSDGGFSVLSGGGPGMMEAANKGAYYGKSPSVGLNIVLPHEQKPNDYQDLSVKFHHFFPRKVMFVKHAIALPWCKRAKSNAFRLFCVAAISGAACLNGCKTCWWPKKSSVRTTWIWCKLWMNQKKLCASSSNITKPRG